jgi:hypothetical protein
VSKVTVKDMQPFRVLFALGVTSSICLNAPMLAAGAENSWIKPTSGFWEEPASWSLGVLPDATQSVMFTNAGWKALAIGANTAQNFPQSMRVQSLRVGAPVDSFNTLLMNWSGFEQPLQTTSLTVGSNSFVVVRGSVLEVDSSPTDGGDGNLILQGTFIQSDLSQVKARGLTVVRANGLGDATYFLTNGSLTVGGIVIAGGYPGKFVQYGGSNNAGGLLLHPLGEYELYGGQVTATNGVTIGTGDFADYASFVQHGGSVNADMDVNGKYIFNGGTITGRMSVPSATTSGRADGRVTQNSGTNLAVSLDLGLHAGRQGRGGYYELSNGVVRVDSSVTLRGGTFSQYDGVHTIVSNLNMPGFAMFGLSSSSAHYLLRRGSLSAAGLTAQAAGFRQEGGTNLIAGDVVLTALPPQVDRPFESVRYTLADGLFSARNVSIDAFYGGFHQTGGSSRISERLTVQVQAATNGSIGYTLEGGSLTVNTICLSNSGAFYHTGGVSQVTQLFVLPGANERADYKLSSGSLNSARVYLGSANREGTQRGFFTQSGGVHSNSHSIIAYGELTAPEINYYSGTYELFGGLLISPGIGLDGGVFSQAGGTNYAQQLSVTNGGSYSIASGAVITSNTLVQNYAKPAARPRFTHGGDAEHRTKRLHLESGGNYHLAGGVLSADVIFAGASTELRLAAGIVSSNRTIEINGGVVVFESNHSLGHLLFNGISHFDFRGGSTPSVVHFTKAGYEGGALDGELQVHNWDGQYDHFYIDTADAQTPSRLRSIKFIDPAGYPPGTYAAMRRPDGEIVPLRRPAISYTRENNRLVLTWPEGYQLYTSDKVTGPFEPMDAQSGWSATFSDPQRFFVLRPAQ